MRRFGSSLLEMLLVIGILVGLLAITTPVYRDYKIRSDLHNAADQVSQFLGRAKLLAQAGQRMSAWGVSVSHATLFEGFSYDARDTDYDQRFVIPATVASSGLDEVSFAPLTGIPSATGTVILTSLRGDREEVSIFIDRQGIIAVGGDKLSICHCNSNPPKTMQVPDSAWPGHSRHGDYLGACRVPETLCD